MASFKWPPEGSGGDVDGPGSSTDNAVARFDGTTGKQLQNSVVIVGDTGNMSGVGTLSTSSPVTVTIPAAGTKGVIIKAAGSQTANLQEWQNSSSTVLSAVDSSGNLGIGTATPTKPLDVTGDVMLGSAIFFGGTSASFPKIIRGAATLEIWLADDSNYAPVQAASIIAHGSLSTTGSSSGVGINRRSDSAAAWTMYSASGDLQFFSNIAGTDRFTVQSGGNVGIGTGAPNASAALDISSTTGALLMPRMTSTERDALTAANGMVLYNTTTDKLQVRAAGAWVDLH